MLVTAYELVLFDLDGTLFDHEGSVRDGVREWLRGVGIEASEALIRRWLDAESLYIAAWHRGELSRQEQRRARLREILPLIAQPIGDDRALDETFGHYLACYQDAWRAYADVAEVLEAIESVGLGVAVLSNGADRQQRQKIAALGLQQRLGRVFSSDAIGFAKPDPRAYVHVCAELNTHPSVVLHVGDRYELDVVAARAAGLDAVYLDRSRQGPVEEDRRIFSLCELPAILSARQPRAPAPSK